MSDYNPFSLSGKRILVTGASSGIGRATAIECARMGAAVVITGRDAERLQATYAELDTAAGQEHQQIAADLTDPAQLEQLADGLPELQGVVLCAGRGALLPLKFARRAKIDSVFDINFYSPLELLRLLVKGRRLAKDASVVAIDSIGGTRSFTTGNLIYGSSKAALLSAMRYCALELAPRVRVNSLCPGMVETPLIAEATISYEDRQRDLAAYPMGRYGKPQEVAQAAVFLLSDAAGWITGQELVVDGGFAINH